MSFKKPFRAVPVRLGARYKALDRQARMRQRRASIAFWVATSIAATSVFALVWRLA